MTSEWVRVARIKVASAQVDSAVQQAFAWYRSQPLPSFGDLTAEDLVKEGRAEDVKAYLNRIGAGGYA
jgi:hypothetical protein